MSNAIFEKVGECHYPNLSGCIYYALVKIRGKQIRSSLKNKISVTEFTANYPGNTW